MKSINRQCWCAALALGLAVSLSGPTLGQQDQAESHSDVAYEGERPDRTHEEAQEALTDSDDGTQSTENYNQPTNQSEQSIAVDDAAPTTGPDPFTALLVVFTGVVACAAIYQNWQFRQHSRRELRAYVLVTDARIEKLQENTKGCIRIAMTNTGKTPARKFRMVAHLLITSDLWRDEPIPPFECNSGPSAPIAAGSTGGNIVYTSDPICSEDWNKLMIGEYSVFLVGRAWYADIFGSNHTVDFRLRKNFDGNSLNIMSPCVTGNDAT